MHGWLFPTRTIQQSLFGNDSGETGTDDAYDARGFHNVGAWIMGRNMFGPVRGPWLNDDWKGWWGEEPPYHHPVFVLSHQPRAPFALKGGTNFTFVNDGVESALKQAFDAAQGKDVRIGGGASTVRQYLKAGLVDELHFVLVPMLMGSGERIFEGLDGVQDRYEVAEYIPSKTVAHVRIVKKGG